MKLDKRLGRLEKKLITEPTILLMPDGKIVTLAGPRDYLVTLFGIATQPERATPQQTKDLDLIRECTDSSEPGGSRFVELIKCFQHGSMEATEWEAAAASAGRSHGCPLV